MVNSPPCPQCGSPLRWIADQSAWGCDRCRQTFPANQSAPAQPPPQQWQTPPQQQWQQQQQQQQPWPQPATPPAAAAGPRSSKKLMIAIIGGIVVIGGIVAIVVAVTHKKASGLGDLIDLQNTELLAARDEACVCKDEACLKESNAQMSLAMETGGNSGLKATAEQAALTDKTLQEIAVCVAKVPKSAAPPTVAEITAIRDEVCACKDASCVRVLQPKIDAYGAKYLPTFNSLAPDVRKQVIDITTAEKACNDRIGDIPALFAGSYKTSEGAMTLEQKAADPTTVTGTYAKGTITCKAAGDLLSCAWVEPNSSGRAQFKRATNGDLAGTWGLGKAATGNPWTCTLVKPGALH